MINIPECLIICVLGLGVPNWPTMHPKFRGNEKCDLTTLALSTKAMCGLLGVEGAGDLFPLPPVYSLLAMVYLGLWLSQSKVFSEIPGTLGFFGLPCASYQWSSSTFVQVAPGMSSEQPSAHISVLPISLRFDQRSSYCVVTASSCGINVFLSTSGVSTEMAVSGNMPLCACPITNNMSPLNTS